MSTPSRPYPGTVLRPGQGDTESIQAVQQALAALGLDQGFTPGVFDDALESAVRLFQSRQVDLSGHALKVDGLVGPFTWAALFGPPQQPASPPPLAVLPAQALACALSQLGVRETPGQANRGPQVDAYLKAAGIANPGDNPPGGYPWCQAFVYWCLQTACAGLGRSNPAPRTAGVLDHWALAANRPGVSRLSALQARGQPGLVQPGQIFIHDHGRGQGHTGFVERVYPDGRLVTLEGNTNTEANREGLGVFRLERRKLSDPELKGFIDYAGA